MPDVRAPVLRGLGVPAVSYRDAFWPETLAPADPRALLGFRSLDEYSNHSQHPTVHLGVGAHERVACLLAAALSKATSLARQAAAEGKRVPVKESRTRPGPALKAGLPARCDTPASKLQPPLTSFQPAVEPRGWEFGEDVAGNGKPGWWSTAAGATTRRGLDPGHDSFRS